MCACEVGESRLDLRECAVGRVPITVLTRSIVGGTLVCHESLDVLDQGSGRDAPRLQSFEFTGADDPVRLSESRAASQGVQV